MFDRRKSSNWFLSVVRCWWLGSLDRIVLGKSRKGKERRYIGERRNDWIGSVLIVVHTALLEGQWFRR